MPAINALTVIRQIGLSRATEILQNSYAKIQTKDRDIERQTTKTLDETKKRPLPNALSKNRTAFRLERGALTRHPKPSTSAIFACATTSICGHSTRLTRKTSSTKPKTKQNSTASSWRRSRKPQRTTVIPIF